MTQPTDLATEPSPYETRVVAYFDILGWKRACVEHSRLGDVKRTVELFVAIAKSHLPEAIAKWRPVRTMPHEIEERVRAEWAGIEMTVFSDNVVLSSKPNAFPTLLTEAGSLAIAALEHGFLVRGAVP